MAAQGQHAGTNVQQLGDASAGGDLNPPAGKGNVWDLCSCYPARSLIDQQRCREDAAIMVVLCDENPLVVARAELLIAQGIVLPTDHRCMRDMDGMRAGPASPAAVNFLFLTTYLPAGLLQSLYVVSAVVWVRSLLSSGGFAQKSPVGRCVRCAIVVRVTWCPRRCKGPSQSQDAFPVLRTAYTVPDTYRTSALPRERCSRVDAAVVICCHQPPTS